MCFSLCWLVSEGDAPTSASILPALSSEIRVLTEPMVPLHFQLPPTMNCNRRRQERAQWMKPTPPPMPSNNPPARTSNPLWCRRARNSVARAISRLPVCGGIPNKNFAGVLSGRLSKCGNRVSGLVVAAQSRGHTPHATPHSFTRFESRPAACAEKESWDYTAHARGADELRAVKTPHCGIPAIGLESIAPRPRQMRAHIQFIQTAVPVPTFGTYRPQARPDVSSGHPSTFVSTRRIVGKAWRKAKGSDIHLIVAPVLASLWHRMSVIRCGHSMHMPPRRSVARAATALQRFREPTQHQSRYQYR